MQQNGRRACFQVITDTHVTMDAQHVHNRNFERALLDIAALEPDSMGIMHVGDITDHGWEEEYVEMARIWEQCRERGLTVPIRFAHGNHDLFGGETVAQLERFQRFTAMPGPYHAHEVDGYLFLFLGSEQAEPERKDFAYLSVEQLNWLEQRLKSAEAGKPVFVFLHQPLMNTVSGSLEAQGWHGVIQDEELHAIVRRYPQVILFSGHTHWELGAPHALHGGDGHSPAMLNAASVGYLWTDEDEHKSGSQGFFVDIYEDRVIVKGRDFEGGRWVESAVIELGRGVQETGGTRS
ncbi:calcineurin-like phosphoesterase family protein [Paenibacillus methanolicus]|uniref:Calcineurin-like phosphoesterase family protein n=2 Tax=Paenibacillus methanolicus TaxID=582686 RepID=A0A5S5CGI8_9BACL|nr:calcineurin-like phosphoesterase family protein [Paenibacillus methanolicus]